MTDRTYRYATWEPLYPFGFGLGYTTFAYSDLKLEQYSLQAGEALEFSLNLTNSGAQAGEEVVQVYLSDMEASSVVPFHKLVAFQRVALSAGECRQLRFKLEPEALMFINDEGEAVLEAGRFRLVVGGCSPGPRGQALGAPQPVSAEFQVA